MRAALLVLLLLMSTLPLHHASAETQPGLTCPETASLVPGQPMAVTVLQHGLEPYALSITNTSLVEVGALTNTTVGGNQSWTVTLTAALPINDLACFISQPLPEGQALGCHIASAPFETWHYLGAITNEAPSTVFKTEVHGFRASF